ncbi:HlyD family secretion protein [Ectothiorhodospira lacustris]|uniref:HlyD family secretion protein n=1 Tax=Ectothiorhodospira lacustris TaxID=2899127 RepID=UPI001EE7D609|nr:HlyD family efflux transporter periplasmic adaptor subunit [Ectothiorhodospira lacustris]MCG5501505.1 HlyD family efflux transporter periplasmic adaptor subunit [Ectothiorhodospira lacustris]MCG5509678.1 HlyD family efflux transporter periplasmic adaptor subunit [Ectothiorhodospira lacustris]MCG5523089.1 HlyD family efflux transporter periplasmic adaptor subunit [Ectothiorhodospira lacustris]
MHPPLKTLSIVATLLVVAAGTFYAWMQFQDGAVHPGLASGNGRIEATEVDVATKLPGRVAEIFVDEGDFVTTGQVLAQMDTRSLEAQLAEARAQHQQALTTVLSARAQVALRRSDLAAAQALVVQRESELDAAQRRLVRSESLSQRGAISEQILDDDRARTQSTRAAVDAAKAQAEAVRAAIAAAEAQVTGAESGVTAAAATITRIEADILDSRLTAPRDARVQFRVAQPGEVLGAGGRVLNLVDLSDVYMTFFLPTEQAGRVALGSEARIILDAAPQYVIPARISFVASTAQFTPKTVETASERQKLMFRVRAQIDRELLQQHLTQVKTGLPGVVWVKLDPQTPWPDALAARVPRG